MHDLIRRAAAWLLGLWFGPGTGRHRTPACPAPPAPAPRTEAIRPGPPADRLPAARSPYGLGVPLDGGASALVRPYLLACDRERMLRRRRRLALVLAADLGIELDRHVIGAEGVTA
ncbi:hypothetical protein HHX38_04505 [Streptomyces sp. PKU-MA01144]|uniref:hypothetical protein n=1 Tax=Streptomyces TaxID=1883 RepID=UPI00037E2311|nr:MULTISPECIES: hypothetical protein [Streptomyces]MCY0981461.1 hypothetical protein [Streptomyces tirandamycinicus]NNJ03399.1 hypothetical protein [Streptomyces sp. PKU-MA01144]